MRSKGFHLSLALVASLGAVSLVGCGGGDGDSARLAQTVDASKNTVSEIQLVQNEGYVHYNSFYQFELKGLDKDKNAVDLTSKATWKITEASAEKIGTLKNGYFKAAGVKGTFKIVAEYAGLTTQPQEIIVSDANLTQVTIDATPNSVEECLNVTLTAKATFEENLVLPYPLTWEIVEGAGIASFKDTAKGILSTTGNGTVKVIASGLDNSSKKISSEVFAVEVHDGLTKVTLATNPAKTELRDGETATVTVKGIYKDPANPIDITGNATLSASPGNLLKFEGTKITAQNGTVNGSPVTLKGSCGGADGTQEIIIKERQLKSIEVKNSSGGATANLTVAEGSSIDLNVTATYADDTTKDDYTSNVFWKIDDRNNNIPADSESKLSISSAGVLNVSGDLNLGINALIYVIAEVRDSDGNVLENASGAELKDEINITITPN